MIEIFLKNFSEIFAFVWPFLKDFEPGRLLESLIFLAVLLAKLKPHLKRVEDRMAGIESNMKSIKDSVNLGFSQGNARFNKIEQRIEILEAEKKTKPPPELIQ